MLFLSRDILGYKDVREEIHGPLLNSLQKFPEPYGGLTKEEHDFWTGSTWRYKPLMDMDLLPGKRRRLILDPRSFFKTTLNIQAHSIQWILNYPDIAIAIFQSSLEKAELILKEIKHHFQYNPRLRALFPELCPQKRIEDFGTKGEFTTPGRSPYCTTKESTVTAMSIDKGTAGMHYHVIKCTDIVEPENSKTKERCEAIITSFDLLPPLLVSPTYWIDVEGTRYHFADLYGVIIKKYLKQKAEGVEPQFQVYSRGVYKIKRPDGLPQQFVPEELDNTRFPFLKDETGERVSWWPDAKRFPVSYLKEMEEDSPYSFSCQYLNSPRGGIGGKEIFPPELFTTIKSEHYKQNVRIACRDMSVDTAETQGKRSNFSAITIGAWDWNGRLYIEKIAHGKWLASELVEQIFDLFLEYRPTTVKIEETSFVRGLKPTIEREMERRGVFMPIEFIKRENNIGKNERIQNTLEPYYQKQLIRFVDRPYDRLHAAALEHLREEMQTFPLGNTDDILDTIADLFQNKEQFGRLLPRPTGTPQHQAAYEAARELAWQRLTGTEEAIFADSDAPPIPL